MRLTQFGTVALPAGDGSTKHNIAGLSGLVSVTGGAFDQLGGAFSPQAKTLQRGFTVYATSTQTIEEQIDALMQQASLGRRLLRGVTRDGDTLLTWAKVVGVDMPRSAGSEGYQTVNVTFEIAHPYWYMAADAPHYFDDGHTFDDGWSFDSGNNSATTVSSTSTSWTLNYTGNVATRQGVLMFSPGAGESIAGITVRNATTIEQATYSGTVGAGEVLTMDMLTETVLLDGGDAYANFSKPTTQAAWLSLAPGNNAIAITCTSVTGTIDVAWYWMRAYLR